MNDGRKKWVRNQILEGLQTSNYEDYSSYQMIHV